MLKILHIAPENYAGVPYSFYQMHNHCGDYSRVITLHKCPLDFPEDICLDLPLPNFNLAKRWRKTKVNFRESEQITAAPYFKSRNIVEKIYFSLNDRLRKKRIDSLINELNLDEFDIIHYDGGLDFYRNASQAVKWKNMGKKIVTCFFGSDLRIRGLIKEIDEISDLNITSEFDHLVLKKDLHYLFYPYDISELPGRTQNDSDKVRIVHSPTNRKYKGTDLIISVIDKIKKERKIDFVLIEKKPREFVLNEKSKSDICIDQVGGTMGGTGYGKAGIESLGMGIPTITNMTKEYSEWFPENPFVVCNNEKELYHSLIELIDNKGLREEAGTKGREWVIKYHGFGNVNKKLYQLYKEHNII
ncbi:MAG: glycosyltransferase [Ignavibacteria bacterium]|jgi:glycosyltransferase involved in cell wall biosynthesis